MADAVTVFEKCKRRGRKSMDHLLKGAEDLADKLQRVYDYPSPVPVRFMHGAARCLGETSYLLRDCTSLSVWQLRGAKRQMICSGVDRRGLQKLRQLFFAGNAEVERLGGTTLMELPQRVESWIDEGVDLVVCETGAFFPMRPRLPWSFTTPVWVDQVLEYPPEVEDLLAGSRLGSIRGRINKARRAGFTWRFSRCRDDFDHFYEHIYLPFITTRHGEEASIASASLQWERWFSGGRGGLILVQRGDRPVGGAICHLANGTCFNVEIGVRDAAADLLQEGIVPFIFWSVCEWGHQQGARIYNLGGSPAWRSHGTFHWKAKWGARVVAKQKPSRSWSFFAAELSPLLRECINRIGFLTKTGGTYYGVHLTDEKGFAGGLEGETQAARRQGLEGIALVSPHARVTVAAETGSSSRLKEGDATQVSSQGCKEGT